MLGNQPAKTDVDAEITIISRALNDQLNNVRLFKFWLDTKADVDLTNLGYSAGEVAQLRSAFTDLDKLRQVYEGTFVVTAGGSPGTGTPGAGNGYDFRTFAKLMFGFGFSI